METKINIDKNLISELVCTRICHDVIGSAGAVANAVEIFEEGDLDDLEDIKSILRAGSFALSARLKFFRMAFGMGNVAPDLAQIETTAKDYLKSVNTAVNLDFSLKNPKLGRLAMLSIMIANDGLVRGGNIKLKENSGHLEITCGENDGLSAERITLVKAIADGKNETISAEQAPVCCLLGLLSNLKYNLTIIEKPFGLVMSPKSPESV